MDISMLTDFIYIFTASASPVTHRAQRSFFFRKTCLLIQVMSDEIHQADVAFIAAVRRRERTLWLFYDQSGTEP